MNFYLIYEIIKCLMRMFKKNKLGKLINTSILGKGTPSARTMLLNVKSKFLIFLGSPWSFFQSTFVSTAARSLHYSKKGDEDEN